MEFWKFLPLLHKAYLFRSNSELGDLGLVGFIHIKLEAMEGHGTTQKFIFLVLFMLSFLQNVPKVIR